MWIQYLSSSKLESLDALVDSKVEVNLLNREAATRLKLKSYTLAITINIFNERLVEIFN